MDARANRFMELFSPAGSEGLMGHLEYQELSPGQVLFYEGDPGDGVYLVLEGEVEITKEVGQRELIAACFEAGDFLGEVTVLDGQGRTMSARARGPASVAKVPIAELLDVLDREPVSVTMNLFQRVMQHLRCTTDAYVQEVVRKEKMVLIGEMAGSIMHDLRNPVQVILSAADMIRMTHEDEPTVTSCERVRVQCDRIVTMAADLLEFSRGESKLHLTHTDTTALLGEFQAANENLFQHPSVKITIEDEPAEIEVDTSRLLRVLQNLVSNAVEAVVNQAEGRVTIQAWVSDSVLNLAVSDNGPGLSDYVRDHLFEPFATQGKKGGIGLGMAIVNSVVAAHRGMIAFETSPETGTRFVARLPQDAASAAIV